MNTERLEYASPQTNGRHPRWAAMVACFVSVAFSVGVALNFICCRPRAQSFAEGFDNLAVLGALQAVLAGYSILAMGLTASVPARRPCAAVVETWCCVMQVAVAYGAIPAGILLSSGLRWADAVEFALLVTAMAIPILLRYALRHRTADWPI